MKQSSAISKKLSPQSPLFCDHRFTVGRFNYLISKPGALTKKDHLGELDRQVWLYIWVGAISNFKLTYVMWALSASTGGILCYTCKCDLTKSITLFWSELSFIYFVTFLFSNDFVLSHFKYVVENKIDKILKE